MPQDQKLHWLLPNLGGFEREHCVAPQGDLDQVGERAHFRRLYGSVYSGNGSRYFFAHVLFIDALAIQFHFSHVDDNYARYRELLPSIEIGPDSTPCIPSLGILLKDLIDIEDEERQYLLTIDNRVDIINFYRLQRQFDVINRLLQYRRLSYSYVSLILMNRLTNNQF